MKKYNIDFKNVNLKGEELLTLDEILSDIIVFSEEQEDEGDSFYRYIEKYHEQKYMDYCSYTGYVAQPGNSYDDNAAWMYAQRAVIKMEINRLGDDIDDKIDNYFSSKGWNCLEEKTEIWEKAVKVAA